METNDELQEIIGEPVPDDYEKELLEMKALISYEKGIGRLDEFAKWLFSTSTIVGVLGTGFSIFGAGKLSEAGKAVFAAALAFLALALFMSCLSLIPVFLKYIPSSKSSIQNVIEKKLIVGRGIKLKFAGSFFAISILLAGSAPIISNYVSLPAKEIVQISKTVLPLDKISVTVFCAHIKANSKYSINIYGVNRGTGNKTKFTTFYNTSRHTDMDGNGTLEFILGDNKKIFQSDSLLLQLNWFNYRGGVKDSVIILFAEKQ